MFLLSLVVFKNVSIQEEGDFKFSRPLVSLSLSL